MDFKSFLKKANEKSSKKNKGFKIAIISLWIFFFIMVVIVPTYIITVSNDLMGLYGGMPSIKALENPENDLSSDLLSSDGVSLGRYYRYNRSQVTYDELSPALVNTLLSSEDHRFYKHPGIDLTGLMRAVVGKLTMNYAGGGSTITMQLAENLFNTMTENEGALYKVGGLREIIIKTKEWIIAVQLERNFTKEEIMAMYFNTVSFGSLSFGIKAAAETFFSKQPSELTYSESAVLVGLLQGTYAFSPIYNYDNSLSKRNQVLGKIYRHGHISKIELDTLRAQPINTEKYNVANQNTGIAPYFRKVIRPYLLKWCKENNYDLHEDGLKIYTTLDSRMQKYAESAVSEHMSQLQKLFDDHWKGRNPWVNSQGEIPNFVEKTFKRKSPYYDQLVKHYGKDSDSVNIAMNLKKKMTVFSWQGEIDTLMSSLDSVNYYERFLNTGMMSMDPHTGHIKAWVGGIDHKYFKFDHVKQGKRQPGSTFKPFVYGTAIEQGYPPCYEVPDVMVTFDLPEGGTWTTPNADGSYGTGEKMTIRQGMARSINTITSHMMKVVGPKNVVDFAHRVGITSKLDAVPSLCLGVSDVTVFELVGAYSTYVNKGIYTEPYFITKIEDKNGNVIENFVPKTRQAISQQTAYKMIYMLRGGVEERDGTSIGINRELKINNEVGGKTGTTNNASDGWYMGVTNDLVTGVWVGGDERSIHFRNWYYGQGAKTARPIWEKYMLKVYEDEDIDVKKGPFERPPGGIDVNLDCSRYNQASPSDSTAVEEIHEDDMWNDDDFN